MPFQCFPKQRLADIFFLIGSHVSLSLRGVTIYNNSKINLDDIGGSRDDEALQCHTDLVSCCDNELTENASALAEWYYPNGSKVSSVDRGIDDSNNVNDTHFSSGVFFTSRSQSVIRLLASRGTGSTEIGQYCCKIQDQYGSSQTLCANLGKYIFKLIIILLATIVDMQSFFVFQQSVTTLMKLNQM